MPVPGSQGNSSWLLSIICPELNQFNYPILTQPFVWRGLRQTKGIRGKAKRVLSQFSPHDWTSFKWEGTTDFTRYFSVVLLLAVFLAAELNPFYLKVCERSLAHSLIMMH
jgi:hypothetical protein